jgi:hypothetical protein
VQGVCCIAVGIIGKSPRRLSLYGKYAASRVLIWCTRHSRHSLHP